MSVEEIIEEALNNSKSSSNNSSDTTNLSNLKTKKASDNEIPTNKLVDELNKMAEEIEANDYINKLGHEALKAIYHEHKEEL